MSRYILVVAFGRWAPHGGVPLAAVKAVVEREAVGWLRRWRRRQGLGEPGDGGGRGGIGG